MTLPTSRNEPSSSSRSMRSRQVSLPRLRWRTTPGSSEPGARRAAARRCSVRISSSTGAQVCSALPAPAGGRRRRRRCRPRAVTTTTDSSAPTASPASRSRTARDHAGAGRGHDRLHLHGADAPARVAGGHRVARAHPHLEHRRVHRADARPVVLARLQVGGAERRPVPPMTVGVAVLPIPRARRAEQVEAPSGRRPTGAGAGGAVRAGFARRAAWCGRRRRGRRGGPGSPAAAPGWWAARRRGTRRAPAACGRRPRSATPAELDEPMTLASSGSNCGRRGVADVAAGVDPHAGPAAPCRR